MIPKDKLDNLVRIYLYVCDSFHLLYPYAERYSNNDRPEFTDEEVMTIYLYAIDSHQLVRVKQIHRFANDHLRSWFPKLGSYQAFNNRLNRLGEAFAKLSELILADSQPGDCILDQNLMDDLL